MKAKSVVLLILISVVSMLFSTAVVSESPLQVISQNSGQIRLRLQTPQLELKADGSYQSLKMLGAELTADDGMPALPMFSTFVAIPAQGGFSVSMQSGNFTNKSGVFPKPVFATEELEAKGTYNLAAYNSNSLYPVRTYAYSPAQIIRDFRVVQINLFPVQYDGATQSLRICTEMTVEITMNSSTGENELAEYNGYSPAFTNLYESMICNFDAYRDPLMAPANPRILLIHGNSTDATFLAQLNEFVVWKRQKGYEVNVISTALTGGTSNTAIRTYIQYQYNNMATRPDFIILLGDVTGSYAIPAFTETMSSYGGEGDYPYTHLAGTDLLGDVFIGRISAENISQLVVLFSKIYTAEKNVNTNPAAAAWLNRMLLIGDPDSSGVSTRYVNMFIKELAETQNPDYSFIENYSSGFSNTINSGINQGVGFFNYRGYIGMSGWVPGSSLANGVKLPHATILTCSTGSYATSEATSEKLIRLGTSASPAGSITAIGMATSGTHTMFNNCLNSGLYEGIFINKMRSMGEALLNARLYIKAIYGATHDTQANYFAHWCNLMGDPTVEVWTGIPGVLTLNAPVTLPIGTNVLDVQVSDSMGNPARNISVTAYSNSLQAVIAKGFTDDEGNLSLTLSGGLQSDVLITASAHNYKPVQQTVATDGSGSLVFMTKQIFDSGASGSIGNNDGYAEAGETIAVAVEIKNTTGADISGVTATISSDDSFVTVINNQSSFNSIASGSSQTSLAYYTFSIASNIPSNNDIRFVVALVDGSMNQYSCVFHITAYNANLFVENHTVNGGGNNILDPAENGFLQIGVKNNSVFGIQDIYAELRSFNDLVTVTDSVSFVGNIPAGAISSSIDGFEVFARALLIPGMQMPMRVRLFNSSGFEQISEFNIPIGQVNMNTPLGPDAYGYFIYDVTDTDYTDCPSYEWVEINPAIGGSGTQIQGFNDAGDSSSSHDEGDQPGSVVLKTLDLPFSFPFYGVNYNQITVCANGFIALGITGNGEFRNYRLPGGYGPSPMIAAFWDDLILISDGGIYKYYDAAEHRFIVQYHKMRNGYNRTSEETFQVIFYDPLYYPTSMGDGMIKIQYKTFNNVDQGGGGGYSPLHGNYATVGIKDHTNTRGLEFTYNNQYPPTAAPLASGKALLITTAPVLHENAFLVVDNLIVSDLNANGIAEPGETIELGMKLMNLGLNTAQEVMLVASTNSDYASMGNSVSAYSDIPGDTSGVNLSAIVMQIDLDCPDGIVIPVNCMVTIAGNSWEYSLSITVHKPAIEVSGLYMNDSMGNGNGLIDPGESFELIVNYTNNSSLDAKNITSNIMCLSQYVTIDNQSLLLPGVPSGTTCQAVYPITISPDVIVGNNLTFYLTYLGDLVTAQNEQLILSVGTTGMNEDFEANNGNFVASPSSGWGWGTSSVAGAHSGSKIWGTVLNSQYPDNATYLLSTPSIFVGTNFMLEFWHRYSTEANYDGGNVKVSTNNGSTWSVITPEGGYPNANINVLGGPGYAGNSGGWQLARFNLAAYANQSIQFRFTFNSDYATVNDGWFIDDVRTTGFVEFAGKLSGSVTSSDTAISFANVVVKNNLNWGTHPDPEGNYALYLPIGTHPVSAAADGYYSLDPASISLSMATQTATQDFYLGYLAPASGLNYGITSGNITLNWNSPLEPEYPIIAYKVFRKVNAGAFEQVGYVTETSYREAMEFLGTNYQFHVVCSYAQGNSLPTGDLHYHYTTANSDDINPALVTKLMGNYPNPFNPDTNFRFSLKELAPTKLYIYNIKGQLVKKLVDDVLPSGEHQIRWNGRDTNNQSVASGIYLYRLESKNFSETKRAILMK